MESEESASKFGEIYETVTKTLRKKLVVGALGLATLSGTWGGNNQGFPPISNVKTGNSYGINVGIYTDYSFGASHYGLDLSVFRYFYGGDLNGIGISALSTIKARSYSEKNRQTFEEVNKSEVNGLEFSLVNLDTSGLKKVKGLQVGLMNQARAGRVIQVGLYNSTSTGEIPMGGEDNREVRRGALLNYAFE